MAKATQQQPAAVPQAVDWPEVRRKVAAGESVSHGGGVFRNVDEVDAAAAAEETPAAKRARRDALRQQLAALDAEVSDAGTTDDAAGPADEHPGDADAVHADADDEDAKARRSHRRK